MARSNEGRGPILNRRRRGSPGTDSTPAATVTSVRTDDAGRWQASVNPQDIPGMSAMIGMATGMPVKYAPGQPLDAAAARAGTVEVRGRSHP